MDKNKSRKRKQLGKWWVCRWTLVVPRQWNALSCGRLRHPKHNHYWFIETDMIWNGIWRYVGSKYRHANLDDTHNITIRYITICIVVVSETLHPRTLSASCLFESVPNRHIAGSPTSQTHRREVRRRRLRGVESWAARIDSGNANISLVQGKGSHQAK